MMAIMIGASITIERIITAGDTNKYPNRLS